MTSKVTMVARRAFPRRDDNGDGVRRVQPGETITATTDDEAKALENAGKAKRKPAEPAKKEG